MFPLWFGPCRFILSGEEGARCSVAAGCVGWCREDARWCQALLHIAAALLLPTFPSPHYQVVPQAPQHLGQLSPCLVAALLPALLCGCLCGFAAGWSPPFPTASLGLANLAGYMGVFLGKPSGFSQAGSLAGAGGSASRRQPAKPCCESAWPINI